MEASANVQKLLVDSAPLILASLIGMSAQQVMMNYQQALQNQGIRY